MFPVNVGLRLDCYIVLMGRRLSLKLGISLTALLLCPGGFAADKTGHLQSSQQLTMAVIAAAKSETPNPVQHRPVRPLSQTVGRLHLGARQHQGWDESVPCEQDPLSTKAKLCGLRWRDGDAFATAIDSYNDMTQKTKSRFIGKDLAKKIEFDDQGLRFKHSW